MWVVSGTMKNETADKENLLYFFKIEELVDLQRRLTRDHFLPHNLILFLFIYKSNV